MKIERQNLRQLIESGVQKGDAPSLQKLVETATPAEIKEALDQLAPETRRAAEKLLGNEPKRMLETTVPGRRVHDIRAEKRQPWWSGVQADPLPAPLYPEPARDVDVHGERFSKDDVVSMLRSLAR